MSRLPSVLLTVTAVVAGLVGLPASPVAAAPAGRQVVSREAVFELVNTNDSPVACLPLPDGKEYEVRGRLVGPARAIAGESGPIRINVLVHDAGTGGWFFNLRDRPAYDYATQLAKQGQTSLVLDRLGYDRSPLRDGDATCLGAQVHMLHQVVQHLYAGRYDWNRGGGTRPHASHVLVHGHGTGATIARLEAAEFSDVQGLVLMSPTSSNPSATALDVLRGQASTCLRGAGFAPYGATRRAFRRALFATAPAAVQRAAALRRNSTPCGDVASLAAAVLASGAEDVDVPVLVLQGGADARRGGDGLEGTTSARLVRRTFADAGSALPLERSAPAVRRAVLRFLGSFSRTTR